MAKNTYDPKQVEQRYYQLWQDRGYFEIEGNKDIQKKGKNFCIMMPPPNVTGFLHIGHALTFTLQDIMVRYKRMDGYKTLWQPGTDHAGIATQNVVEKRLLEQGIKKEEIGREAFLDRVWEWKAHSGGTIVNQLKSLGVSPAWSRERFTMDEGLKTSVKKAFVQLYEKGLIVRDNYMVNWCTHDGALSDIEVEYEEHEGHFYHMRYPMAEGNESIVVATTRPETYFGDTAVMVHPDDERYAHLVGKKVRLPLTNKEIEIITDEHVDMEFGTGMVKVTPAHDPNDYEVGKRHGLEFVTVFNEAGVLNHHCGEFEGLERLGARSVIVDKLKQEGYIEKIEPHTHQVGHCYRCKNVVEPYISKQWFVKKQAASEAIEKVNNKETTFFPAHWKNSYDAWMRELRDWCISRQLWWGHRIPVFYCNDCGAEFASQEENPKACPKCESKNFFQDPDVLDTWFSSALWPFSTLGWGNEDNDKVNPEDMEQFYPNSLLITGFDILFFWVARMMMMGQQFQKQLPFSDVYLHALVRDANGQKMSKSLGNVIDPLDTIDQYSADALRFTLAVLAVQGRDIKLSEEKLIESRNFTNKLFNAANFLRLNVDRFNDLSDINVTTDLGNYMVHRFNVAAKESRAFLDQYRFNDAATVLYRFLWGEFCDWGIELSKASKESIGELGAIFKESMKLLHPFMPFITEHLYQELSGTTLDESESIMVQPYPVATDSRPSKEFDIAIEAIVAVRRCKTLVDMANQKIGKAIYKLETDADTKTIAPFIAKLGKVEEVEFVDQKPDNAVSDVSDNLEVYIPTESIDMGPIIDRLTKQREKLQKEAGKLEGMLGNDNFVQNAPQQVVEKNKAQLTETKEKLAKVSDELNAVT